MNEEYIKRLRKEVSGIFMRYAKLSEEAKDFDTIRSIIKDVVEFAPLLNDITNIFDESTKVLNSVARK